MPATIRISCSIRGLLTGRANVLPLGAVYVNSEDLGVLHTI